MLEVILAANVTTISKLEDLLTKIPFFHQEYPNFDIHDIDVFTLIISYRQYLCQCRNHGIFYVLQFSRYIAPESLDDWIAMALSYEGIMVILKALYSQLLIIELFKKLTTIKKEEFVGNLDPDSIVKINKYLLENIFPDREI